MAGQYTHARAQQAPQLKRRCLCKRMTLCIEGVFKVYEDVVEKPHSTCDEHNK